MMTILNINKTPTVQGAVSSDNFENMFWHTLSPMLLNHNKWEKKLKVEQNEFAQDMYFDHFLAANWNRYHPQSLSEFSSQFYIKLKEYSQELPENIQKFTAALVRYNWFEAYASITDLQLILLQMEKRTKFPSYLGASTDQLKENYTYFHCHFTSFMEEVILYSKTEIQTL